MTKITGVSVLLLTRDEEVNIADCLQSVCWSDDVVVLDSFSTDRTVEIAQQLGARMYQRKFDDYASQRNYAITQITFKNPWLLLLDADERVPDELRAEIVQAVACADESVALYLMRNRNYLFGRWIRGSSGYPTWLSRLVRVGQVWFERPLHEQVYSNGGVQYLRGHLIHYPFNKGFSSWFAKHNRYSTMEAELLEQNPASIRLRDFFAHGATTRRRATKAALYRMPARPAVVFVALYVLRGGMLDGAAGLTYALLRAWYEYMIDCKRIELKRRQLGLPV